MADGALSKEEKKDLASVLEKRHGKVKLIEVEGNPRAVIVKTTNDVAPLLRESGTTLTVGGKALAAVLTSGGVGKLKRKGSEAAALG